MKRAGKFTTVAMACLAAIGTRAGSEQAATGQEPVLKEGEARERVPPEPPPAPLVEGVEEGSPGRNPRDPRLQPIDLRGRRPRREDLDEVLRHAYDRGSARVILGLPVRFVPEGLLHARERDDQRRTIARAQERALAGLGGVESVVRRFETIPYIVVILTPHGADGLRDAPGLASAVLDREERPGLASTTPLIGATTAASRGITGTGQTVAILDTGVDSTHPFLAGAVVDEACFGSCPNGGSSQTGPGSGAPLPAFITGSFHGTHVAGIAAGHATPNVTFRGTARAASIMSINVFHRVDNFIFNFCGTDPSPCARAWTSDVIAGLERVFNRRGLFSIAAVNLSLGGGAFSSECGGSAYDTVVANLRSAGIATVASAGNDGFANALGEPACVPGVISVGATDNADVVPQFSNSAGFLDLLAPGVSVLSSVPGGGFAMASGTSMAAPHVAGTFALLRQRFPNASVFALEQALRQTGRPVLDFGSGVTTPRIRAARAVASPALFAHDFTRDRAADVAVWRPSTGEWWVPGQPTMVWGEPGDKPVAGDYDGDGTTERAIWRPSTGDWWIPGQPTVQWGVSTDVPVPADYDGNGSIDIAVWRPSTGEWWVRNQFVVQWGAPGDVPVPADYDNDGRADVAVWRPSTGQWWVRNQFVVQWGVAGDKPVAADYDGNGTADVAIWRPATGEWWIRGQATVQWGQAGDVPIPRDIGNARAELTVWRPGTGEWFTLIRFPFFNLPLPTMQWGVSTDVPL